MPWVIFICSGNTCRSPMAASLFKHRLAGMPGWTIGSAGLEAQPGAPAALAAQAVVREWGADLVHHRAQRVNRTLLNRADAIVTMTRQQAESLRNLFPADADKIVTLGALAGHPAEDVADPFGQAVDVYRRTAEQLDDWLKAIPLKFEAWLKPG